MQNETDKRRKAAFLLIDDDKFSARFFIRQLKWCAGRSAEVSVNWIDTAQKGVEIIKERLASNQTSTLPSLAIVDLKSSSIASLDFIRATKRHAENTALKIVVFVTTDDVAAKQALLSAGATLVFERHADLRRYRDELNTLLKLSDDLARAA